jgi:hypothetical protein
MNRISFFVIDFLMGAFRSRVSLQPEIAALHHQLSLYQRGQRRPAIASSDRLLWSVLARLWRGWRGALFIVQPRTVILWQRKRFRDYWRGHCQSKILNTWSGHRTAQIDPEKCRKINGREIRF